jgi:hypothetical protein
MMGGVWFELWKQQEIFSLLFPPYQLYVSGEAGTEGGFHRGTKMAAVWGRPLNVSLMLRLKNSGAVPTQEGHSL